MDYNEAAAKTVWSSKTDCHIEKYRKPIPYVTPCSRAENLGARGNSLREILPHGKKESRKIPGRHSQPLLHRSPTSFTNADPSRWSCLKHPQCIHSLGMELLLWLLMDLPSGAPVAAVSHCPRSEHYSTSAYLGPELPFFCTPPSGPRSWL